MAVVQSHAELSQVVVARASVLARRLYVHVARGTARADAPYAGRAESRPARGQNDRAWAIALCSLANMTTAVTLMTLTSMI